MRSMPSRGGGGGSRQQRKGRGRERRKRRTIFDAFVDIDIHVIFSIAIRIGVET
jgi:hypothetical protein